jgi:hypothetical protein
MAKYRVNKTDEQPLRRVEPDQHWRLRRTGDRVSVRLAPGFEASGLVDAVTADHSVVWVDLDGGRDRTLLHCGDGVEIRPHGS